MDIGVDEVDINGFVFNLDFVFCWFCWCKFYGLKYFWIIMFVKFNMCCYVFFKRNVVIF